MHWRTDQLHRRRRRERDGRASHREFRRLRVARKSRLFTRAALVSGEARSVEPTLRYFQPAGPSVSVAGWPPVRLFTRSSEARSPEPTIDPGYLPEPTTS
jgi:hypothetical protein